MDIKNKIYNALVSEQSVFLVGTTDSGKSWFIKNELLPFLHGRGLSVSYFSDCTNLSNVGGSKNGTIIEEVEVLQDRGFLEKNHPAEQPYYTNKYLEKVANWFQELAKIKTPCVYVITRNGQRDINNFMKTVKETDWDGRRVICIEFQRQKDYVRGIKK